MNDRPENERATDQTADINVETEADIAEGQGTEADFEAFMRLAKENEELKDRALRIAADMENLRRRTQREVADAKSYAVANFARDMLSVSDNMRRALDAIPAEAKGSDDAGFKALIEGVEMTERDMLAALERHGVRKLAPEGERFDPNFHQAMFEIPNTDVPNNTVMQVVQTGYVIGERVLRPAMVGVSKGGPKAAPVADAPAEPGPPNAQAERDA
ncbi:nucleotide exchange factor GrpE [Aliihoeflea aestuarii]|jgi:molecular chaperone GrpE|uniref:nucleotide exchange factor GrpE n=1 Tax=Aliihoeflea aestuarii TaxID=453840 RepID=UPI002091F9B8|nr:nucleotide exchange factor GrpE [Aliihoeflea aestuarii]MCO6391633.1 nucleotide exchange factor GrpE [Aliihoeflea aestuarii]